MTRRRSITIRNSIYALLGVLLLLLLPAVAAPSASARRILFATVLFIAVLLLLACIVLGWAKLERLLQDQADTRVEVARVRAQLQRHVGACEARQVDSDVDVQLRQMVKQWRQRSA